MRGMYRGMLGLLALLAMSVACSDQSNPLEVGLSETMGATFTSGTGVGAVDTVVTVLQREVALPEPITASGVIDQNGGMIHIPETGVRVHVLPGAVTGQTRITVTALEGAAVAYTFEPHGITFGQDVIIDQALQGTNAFAGGQYQFNGAYFPEAAGVDRATGKARITELFPVDIDQLGKKIRFRIRHFSGYLISIGRTR